MPGRLKPSIRPRRTPAQARSLETWDVTLEATIQVLVKGGYERLTTTKVAERARVSVGTLYQYFPNKHALLAAVFERHVDGVASSVEEACRRSHGLSLEEMVFTLCTSFIEAKLHRADLAIALRPVLAELGGDDVVRKRSGRTAQAIAAMLRTANPPVEELSARTIQVFVAAIVGVVDDALARNTTASGLRSLCDELVVLGAAYLRSTSRRAGRERRRAS